MNLQALLLSADEHITKVMSRVLSDLGIGLEHCSDQGSAANRLEGHTYDAVIVDCEDETTATAALQATRAASAEKKPLVLAIVPSQLSIRSTFSLGASFVLYKPVSMDRARASLRAARSLMRRERRSHMRIPVHMLTAINYRGASEVSATMLDLSEGGAAVQTKQELTSKGPVTVQFTLPHTTVPIRATGEVIWRDRQGRSGIRFVDVPANSRHQLRDWLAANARHQKSEAAAASAV